MLKRVIGKPIGVFAFASMMVFAPVSMNGQAALAKDVKKPLVAQANDDDGVNDPLEPVNRAIFQFNEMVQDAVLRPVGRAYNDHVPATARLGVGNFLDNLSSPVVAANSLLQGDVRTAYEVLIRFLINSTAGIGGLVDVVSELDGELRDEDFGQTLGVWGFGEGFYLVLPIFGPSNPRDAVGKFLVDPYFGVVGDQISNTSTAADYSKQAVSGVDEYAGVVDELDQIKKTSVDYYAAIRSLYRQKRKSEISNGENLDFPPIPNLSYDLVPEDFSQSLAGTAAISAK
ncbi:MAG: VacJ family lipoprotein [Rhodospirillaceae bacterium]|nr:VacJ family lipoprotein [Rhodospirillaceae bacterium]